MKNLDWTAIGKDYPQKNHSEDELLIVVTNDQKSMNRWIIDLEQESVAVLGQEIEYLKAFVGFVKNARHPFALVRWTEEERKPLEKRWLIGQLAKRLKHQFARISGVKILLTGDEITPWQLTIAEDFYYYFQDQSTLQGPVKNFGILVESLEKIHEVQPHRTDRFQYQNNYRDWINENPDTMTSIYIGEKLKKFASQNSCQFKAMEEEELKENGMNLLLAVGQASELSPSRCYLVSSNWKKGDRPLMLVGKGITFDTGGINVKPFEGFVNCMKNDMGGASLMANLFMALVKSGYDKPLALVIPSCENLVAEKSMKPGAVYKSHKGIDVMVEHTDAEGRLILADALSYGEQYFNPKTILVAATLTTAALRQYTGYQTPVYFAPKNFKNTLEQCAEKCGEQFIFHDEFLPFKWANKGKISQLTNMGRLPQSANIGGGSNVAAHFLNEFTESPMIHFDIFASTWNWSGDYPGATYGATGAAFNSIFDAVRYGSDDLFG